MSTTQYGIFIEAREVEYAGLPTGAVHLYLVYRDTTGEEYVLRSGPQYPSFPLIGDMKIETNVAMEDSADARPLSAAGDCFSTALDFGTLTDDEAWAVMVKYSRMIDAADTPYELLQENSNAYVGALLEAALDVAGLEALDPEDMLPAGIPPSKAVGLSSYDELMARVAPPTDGVVRGTAGADTIVGIQIAEVIHAFGGDDLVWAGRGDDLVYGGAGDDRLLGGEGDDRLHGQSGRDIFVGGLGTDVMHAGADRTRDVFVFAASEESVVGEGRDAIHEFRPRNSAKDAKGDVIDLGRIDADAGAEGDQAFRFGGRAAGANSVWYAADRDGLVVRADLDGDAVADLEIRLEGVSSLTADAFLL